MRCVYSCPKSAINFRLFSFFPVPGGYNIEKILNQASDESEIKHKVPQFFNNYIEDDTV